MFSKELALMDRNTTLLMIDDLTAQVKEKSDTIADNPSAQKISFSAFQISLVI